MARQGRKRIEIDLADVERLAEVCDNEEEIARALGISSYTIDARKRESAEFREAIKRGKAKANIFVGGKLMSLIKAGNVAATIFYMKSRCGWKEASRTEISGPGGAPVQLQQKPVELTEQQKKLIDRILDEEF